MSLTFGANTTDKVTHAEGTTTLDNLDPFTWICWVRVTTLTSNRVLLSKGNVAKSLRLSGTGGNLQLLVDRATIDTSYVTNNTPLATLGAWRFVAVTFSSAAAAGEIVNIYVGSLTSAAAESTYGTATDGVDALNSDAATNLIGGNISGSLAIQGDVAWVGVWNRLLTPGEIRDQQFRPRKTSGCLLLSHYGWQGSGVQADYSGNAATGTITGATLGAIDVPLVAPFGWPSDDLILMTGAALEPDGPRPRRRGRFGFPLLGGLRL